MENYITIVLIAVFAAIGYLSYRVSKDLEAGEDQCPEI